MDVNVFTKAVGRVFGFVASIMKRVKIETAIQTKKQAAAAVYTEPKCGVYKCNQTPEQSSTVHSLDTL